VNGAKFAEFANHRSVLKGFTGIFAGGWFRLKTLFGDSDVEIHGCAGERRGIGIDTHLEGAVVFLRRRHRCKKEASFGMRSSGEDLLTRVGRAAADKLDPAINDHLRGVDTSARKRAGVVVLALREIARRVRVAPTEVVPVINMFLEGDDLDAVEGLVLAKFLEKPVGGRATRAALGGKEFHDDGLFLRRCIGSSRNEGPASGDRQGRGHGSN